MLGFIQFLQGVSIAYAEALCRDGVCLSARLSVCLSVRLTLLFYHNDTS